MRLRLYLLYLLLFFICAGVEAQKETGTNTETSSLQKVLLHLDKNSYFAGDTLFFKAYLYTDFTLDMSATNLYVGIYNAQGLKISEGRFPVLNGLCYGNIELSDTLSHGIYFFQAMTARQYAEHDSTGYLKQIAIINPSKVPEEFGRPVKPEYSIEFFPQGGSLVEGLSNEIIVNAKDQFGNPVAFKGKLVDESGTSLTEFGDSLGTGRFYFFPELKNYAALVSFQGSPDRRFILPQVKAYGATLRISGDGAVRNYIIENHLKDPGESLQLRGVMNDNIVFQQGLKSGTNVSGTIPISKLPSGILYLAVAGQDGTIYAQARCFIDNGEYSKKVQFIADTLNMSAAGRNVFTFTFEDTLIAGLSVSVTDPELTGKLFQSTNDIVADALYANERTIPDHFKYFSSDQLRERRERMENLVRSDGWYTPDWAAIFNTKPRNKPSSGDDFITMRGTVYKEGTKKPVREGDVNFMVTTKDSVTVFLQAPIDNEGRFSLKDLSFEDTASFRFQMNKGKGGPISIELEPTSIHLPDRIHIPQFLVQMNFDKVSLPDPASKNEMTKLYDLLNDRSGKYKTLEEIVVVAKKKNPTVLVNQKYTSGLFSNLTQAKVFDLINDPPATGGFILDYLVGRLPGAFLTRKGGSYVLESNRAVSIGNLALTGNAYIPGKFYLNEAEVTSTELAFISLNQVALVKYFPPGSMQISDLGMAPALAIYTKEGDDLRGLFSSMNGLKLPGYTSSDLFYDEDFSQYYNGRKGTILWRPDLFLTGQGKKITIKFINPSRVSAFHILLQGVTIDGEFIYYEQTIYPH